MNEERPNPITTVLAQLDRRLAAVPLQPFDIVRSNGPRPVVPTPDHLTLTRLLRRILLENDAMRLVEIGPLHVVTIEDPRKSA